MSFSIILRVGTDFLLNSFFSPEAKLFAEFIVIAGRYFKYAGEWKRMATVSELRTKNFNARMKYA